MTYSTPSKTKRNASRRAPRGSGSVGAHPRGVPALGGLEPGGAGGGSAGSRLLMDRIAPRRWRTPAVSAPRKVKAGMGEGAAIGHLRGHFNDNAARVGVDLS